MLDRRLYRIKNYPRGYKKKLKRINKPRERLNVANYITNVFNDLEDAYYDYLAYGDPSRDMYGQSIDKTSDEYLFDEDPSWLEYLGRNLTLEDELAYCDKRYADYEPEEEYDFTDEEINYYRNSYMLSCEKNEVETDPVKRAMNTFEQFINRLKEFKSITLFKENVKRFIKYEQNYGCTISSFTANGDCNTVYAEYLYLISNGFQEEVTKEEDWTKYIKNSWPF